MKSSSIIENTNIKVVEYSAVIMTIISTGTAFFFLYHVGFTLLMLLLSAFSICIYNNFRFSPNFFTYTYSILIILNTAVYGYEMVIIGDIIFLISSVLIYNSLNYNTFRKAYLNILLVICIISLSLYILFIFSIITPPLYGDAKEGTHGHYIYAFHAFGGGQWGLFQGLAGLFWEPGIFQLIINTCLIHNLDLFEFRSNIRKRKLKLFILILTILLTRSTTGYLVLGLIILGIVFYKSKRSKKFKILSIFFIFLFWIFISITPVITEKFESDNPSLLVRSNDMIALLQALWERPLIGVGVFSELFEQISFKYGMTKSLSPGLLLQSVQFGILWLLAYYYSALKEYKNRMLKIPKVIFLIILTFLGLCEPLAFSPIILSYAIPFKSYK